MRNALDVLGFEGHVWKAERGLRKALETPQSNPLKRGFHGGLRYYPPLPQTAPDTPAKRPPAAAPQPEHPPDHPLDPTLQRLCLTTRPHRPPEAPRTAP